MIKARAGSSSVGLARPTSAAAGGAAGPQAQAARRKAVHDLHRAHWFDRFDDEGEYTRDVTDDFRRRMWHAMAFLAGEPKHVTRGNAMLRHLLPLKVNHFWASGVSSILARFPDRLAPDLRTALLEQLAEALPAEAQQRFRGYNDNYPAMAALSAVVGGELCGDATAVAGGVASLRSLRKLLTRRGFLSEYASPTYSAITLTCLAEIAELAQDQEARALALAGEQRVWFELASRFHPGTSSVAGPHSRAYMVDMLAHVHNAHVVLYQVLGEAVFVNPISAMFRPIEGQAIHGGMGLSLSHGVWQTVPTYHPTAEAVELALHKPLPCTVEADTEQAGFPRNVWEPQPHPQTPYAEFPAGAAHLVTHLTEDYALGTSSNVFLDGYQHTGVHLAYRRRRPSAEEPATVRDVATLFARYLQRDRLPDRHKHLGDEGRTLCLQHQSTAMVAYLPKLGWGSKPALPDATAEPTESLALSLLLPRFWGADQELFLGDAACEGWAAESFEPVPIYIKDGPVMMAIHPLALDSPAERPAAAIRLREVGGFGMIDLINYQGPPRTFTAPELLSTRNGFVLEVASEAPEFDFAAFRQQHAQPELVDRSDRSDGMRTITYRRTAGEALELEMSYSPISEGEKYREINGQMVRPPHLALPGVSPSDVPWNPLV